jgi:hypothetical protein
MTEENYYDVKYMLDSFECIVDGDFCTINQSKEDRWNNGLLKKMSPYDDEFPYFIHNLPQ